MVVYRMLRSILVVFVVMVFANISFGRQADQISRMMQSKIAAQEKAAFQTESDWNAAKKLHKFSVPPERYKNAVQDFAPEQLQEGSSGMIQKWSFRVLTIIDEKNVILALGSAGFWLEDFPTAGLADGESVRVVDRILATGTKSYTTVAGSIRTVKAFKMINDAEFQKHKEKLADAEAKRLRDERAGKCEVFKTKAGESISAVFVDYKKAKAIFEDVDGEKIEVAMTDLDEASATRVRELFKKLPKDSETKKKK